MGRKPRITREQLLQTARTIFLAKGYEAATLSDIATPLGVTPAAILRHVESKQSLFAECMTAGDQMRLPPVIEELARVDAATDPRIVLRRVAEEFIPFARAIISAHLVVSLHRTTLEVPFDPQRKD